MNRAQPREHFGRAFTVRYAPVDLEPDTVGDYIDDVPAGSVLVLEMAAVSIARFEVGF